MAKAEEGVLKKLANAIKNFASKIKEFILTHTTNEAAKTFVKDVEALSRLADMFSNAADNIQAKSEEVITNEQKNNTAEGVESGDVRYSIKDSEKQNVNAEHSHQWLDENGWEYRNAFVMDKHGKLYSVTLNIAKSKDGRNILYDIKTKLGTASCSQMPKARGART